MIASSVAPAADQVITFLDFLEKARNLLRIVLQIPIHGNNHFAARKIESRLQRWGLAEIAPQPHQIHPAIMLVNVGKHLERIIAAAVVDKNQLIAFADRVHHLCDFHVQRWNVLLLVIERDDDGISDAGFASHTVLARNA